MNDSVKDAMDLLPCRRNCKKYMSIYSIYSISTLPHISTHTHLFDVLYIIYLFFPAAATAKKITEVSVSSLCCSNPGGTPNFEEFLPESYETSRKRIAARAGEILQMLGVLVFCEINM